MEKSRNAKRVGYEGERLGHTWRKKHGQSRVQVQKIKADQKKNPEWKFNQWTVRYKPQPLRRPTLFPFPHPFRIPHLASDGGPMYLRTNSLRNPSTLRSACRIRFVYALIRKISGTSTAFQPPPPCSTRGSGEYNGPVANTECPLTNN